jgi:hypothetical protein
MAQVHLFNSKAPEQLVNPRQAFRPVREPAQAIGNVALNLQLLTELCIAAREARARRDLRSAAIWAAFVVRIVGVWGSAVLIALKDA